MTTKELQQTKTKMTLTQAFETEHDLDLIILGSNQTVYNQKKWLLAFTQNGKIRGSCEQTGVKEMTIYKDWFKDPEFQEYFKIAELAHLNRMAEEADRRGIDGVDKGIYWQGERVATEKQYSDNLLMFRMKKLDPAYRDSNQVDVNLKTENVKTIVIKLVKRQDAPEPGQIVEGEATELAAIDSTGQDQGETSDST